MLLLPVICATTPSSPLRTIRSLSSALSSTTTTSNNNSPLITLALIPHREQQRRRRLEQREEEANRRWSTTSGNHPPLSMTPALGIHRHSHRRHYSYDESKYRWLQQSSDGTTTTSTTSSSSAAQVIDALYQGYGTHYVDVWCGSPIPQRQTVIVDTGSGVTAFPCMGCDNCGDDGHHLDHLYNQSASQSFHQSTCQECTNRGRCQQLNGGGGTDSSSSEQVEEECRLGMSYQEGSSWSAFEATDLCYAGGPHDYPLTVSIPEESPPSSSSSSSSSQQQQEDADIRVANAFTFPMTFGCQTSLTGLFRTQLADGIMGMDNANTAFWYQMYHAGKIQQQVFSLCFSRQDTVERKGTEAGAMTLGGSDVRLHVTPMVYATTSANNNGGNGGGGALGMGFYQVHIRHVYLRMGGGGDSATALNLSTAPVPVTRLEISETQLDSIGMVIVDSGTTDTYFSGIIRNAFETVWQDLTGKSYHHNPVKLTVEELNHLPTILFQLKGDEVSNDPVQKQGTSGTYTAVVTGLAGDLDPDHPLDVILAIPPSHYMEYDERDGRFVARFYMDGSGNVLGANAMMGHDVVFDIPNGRIGWAESHCDYSQLLQTAHLPNPNENGGNDGSNPKSSIEKKKEIPNNGSGDDHDHETPNNDIQEGGNTTMTTTMTNPFQQLSSSCTTTRCRGAIVGGILGFLIVAMIVTRRIIRRRRRNNNGDILPARREYQLTTELELSNVVSEEDDDFVQYRDDHHNHHRISDDDDDYDDDDDETRRPLPRTNRPDDHDEIDARPSRSSSSSSTVTGGHLS